MQKLGKVLWWSSRDENGIIIDPQGNEYYVDRSVLSAHQQRRMSKDLFVQFWPEWLDGVLVATRVSLAKSSSTKRYIDQFEMERTQLNLAQLFD
jgi:hypothetical protein